eukprot:gene7593-5354_t
MSVTPPQCSFLVLGDTNNFLKIIKKKGCRPLLLSSNRFLPFVLNPFPLYFSFINKKFFIIIYLFWLIDTASTFQFGAGADRRKPNQNKNKTTITMEEVVSYELYRNGYNNNNNNNNNNNK